MHPIKAVRSNDFLRHNGIYFVGSLAVSVLNYLFYPILGRLLPTAQFGEVQTLFSLFLQIAIFLGVVTNVAVNVVANEPDSAKRNRVVTELERLTSLLTLAAAIIGIIFIGDLRSFLRFGSDVPFIILGLSLIVSAPLTVQSAFLRGKSAFGRQAANSAIGSFAQIVFAVIFVLAGFGTAGAIGGLVVAQLVTLLLTSLSARRLGLRHVGPRFKLPDLAIIRPQLQYAGLVLIVSLVTTYLFSVDVIVIKHYFNENVAGVYAGIATVGRIIYYLTGSIAVVLLSSVKLGAAPATNRRLLVRSLALHLTLGGAALAVFAIVPRLVIRILIGQKYLPMASLLPRLGLALFVLATASLIFNYDLALRRRSAGVVAVIGAGFTFGLVAWQHSTPTAVVNSILIGGTVLLMVRGLDAIRRYAVHSA